MPITFKEGWSSLNLSKLKKTGDGAEGVRAIAMFWRGKAKANANAQREIDSLNAMLASAKAGTLAADPKKQLMREARTRFGKNDKRPVTELVELLIKEKIDVPQGWLDRGKLTKAVASSIGGLDGSSFNVTQKQLDALLEVIHNDRLRISDREMLAAHDAVSIRVALREAKPSFTSDARVAALLARAVATDGKPVEVTQGVHQHDDPHFDVLMPGEDQQYHVEVTLPGAGASKLTVRSISYMNGATKKEGTTTVRSDKATTAPIVTL